MILFRSSIVCFLCIFVFTSMGCSSSSRLRPAYNPDLTRAEIVQFLRSRDNHVISTFSGSYVSIHEAGSGFGGNQVQVHDSPSRLIENHLIDDLYGRFHLRQEPLMLAPLFRGHHGPDAALTALRVYDRTLYRHKGDRANRHSGEVRGSGTLLIRGEDVPAVWAAIREGCQHHYDVCVRIECLWMLTRRRMHTVEDMKVWLNDHSQEVRLAAAFQCLSERFPEGPPFPSDEQPPHIRAQIAADVASLLIEHLDDPNIHVASRLTYALGDVLRGLVRLETLEEAGAPDFWNQQGRWIYLSWHERVEGRQAIQTWWDEGGRDAFLHAARRAEHERIRRAELSSTTD